MSPSGKLISLDYKNQEQVYAAAKLHAELLSDSPIPQLGRQFMHKFFYSKLIKAGLINCDLYEHQGRYAAFSVYTKYPFTFMKEGRRRYFLFLCLLLFKSLLLKPSRIKILLKVIQIGRQRKLEINENKTGEMLSFGVLESYSRLRDEATGLRISNLLFERALANLKNEGLTQMQGEIKKKNSPSLLLWRSYGGIIKDCNWGREGSYLVVIAL